MLNERNGPGDAVQAIIARLAAERTEAQVFSARDALVFLLAIAARRPVRTGRPYWLGDAFNRVLAEAFVVRCEAVARRTARTHRLFGVVRLGV